MSLYKALKEKLLKKNKIILEFELVYPIIEHIINYEKMINLIDKLFIKDEIKKLRNLMAFFLWLKNSKINE